MLETIKQKIQEIKTNEKLREPIVYLIFGVLTTVISLGSLQILLIAFPKVNSNYLNIISVIIAILFAYVTNRIYVFKSTSKNILKESLKFFGSRAFTAILEIILFYLFSTLMGIEEMLSKLIETVIIIVINYFMSKFFVFKKKAQS